MDCSVEFFDDPVAFLERAGDWLARDPLTATIVSTNAERAREIAEAGGSPAAGRPYFWFATVSAGGEIVGIAMRNAPWAPHPPYVLPMRDEAAEALADAILARGEGVWLVNGSRPAVDAVAGRIAAATDRQVEVRMHTTLYELATLRPPRPTPGRLRRARPDEAELVRVWHGHFFQEAEVQAGREARNAPTPDHIEIADLEHRIEAGQVWFWEDGGRPVQLTTITDPAYGVVRITLVSTPPEHRGRGYAAAAVGAVSRALVERGLRVCLDADVDNPVSNRVYVRLGFEPRGEDANLSIRPGRS